MIAHRYNGVSLGNINPGNGTIWLDDVSCIGTETDITLCPHSGWGIHNCVHDEDVSVRCTVSGMTCYLLLSICYLIAVYVSGKAKSENKTQHAQPRMLLNDNYEEPEQGSVLSIAPQYAMHEGDIV